MSQYRTFTIAITVPADMADHVRFALEALCRGAYEDDGSAVVRELE